MPQPEKLTKKTKQRLNRLKKNAKRLAAYSAAAAATVIITGDRSANAQEVVWDIADVNSGNEPGVLFNLITGSTSFPGASAGNSAPGAFRLASYLGTAPYIAGPAGSTMAGFVAPGGFSAGVNVDATNFSASNSFGASRNFAANISYLSYGNYAYLSANFNNDRGFVGLQFDIAGSLHYGWADLTWLGTGNGIALHAFGYNATADVASHAPVPEPSSLLLLAAGAAGIGTFRRRRKAVA